MKATDQRTRQKALAKGASTHESGLHNASNADFFNGIRRKLLSAESLSPAAIDPEAVM